MKPKFANLFRTATALITISSAAHAQTAVDWNGTTSADWNTAANWNGGVIPTKTPGNQHARINGANPATISADITPPVDIFVGSGAAGTLNHTAGIAATGGGNWMFVGHNGGNGTYNLADTTGTGGTFTGFGTGSGTMNASGRLYIGGFAGTGSTGTVNVNTSGTLAIASQLQIGTNNSVGTLNIDAGSVTSQDWTEIGNGGGSTGNLNMSGGSLVKTGANNIIVGANGSTGNATITGGRLESNNEFWIANNNASKGTITLSGTGELVAGNAFVVGRGTGATGFGKLIMSGGSITKTGPNNFSIGDNNGIGEAEISGGTINANNEFWVGNGAGSIGTMEFSGGEITNGSWVAIGRGAGQGTVDMTGGTWNKTGDSNFIVGGSGAGISSTMNMSGGVVNVAPSAVANRGITWIGEQNGVTGTLNLSGTAEFNTARITLGEQTGATGNLNLNGGTAAIGQLTGGAGNANVTFNGTQIIATANQAAFITNLDTASVGDGGLLIDTQAFNLGSAQNFSGTGTGGLTKTGTGILTLTGTNTWLGTTNVEEGGLVAGSPASLPGYNTPGTLTIADGAEIGVLIGGAGWSDANLGDLLANATFEGDYTLGLDTTNGSYSFAPDISGSKGLRKLGPNTLTLTGTNTHTGGTTISAGTLLAPSPSNLPGSDVFDAITVDAGANLAIPVGGSGWSSTNLSDLLVNAFWQTGSILTIDTTAGDFSFAEALDANRALHKVGTNNLTLTAELNSFSAPVNQPALRADNGTLTFDGTGLDPAQTSFVNGEFWIGSTLSSGANLTLNNTSLTVSSWVAASRINGTGNFTSNINLTNSTLTSGNLSTGFAGGNTNYLSQTVINLTDSTFTNNGLTNLAESQGNITTMTLNGTSTYNAAARFFIGQSADTIATVNVKDDSQINQTVGWTAIGNSGSGTLNLEDNAVFTNNVGDFNVADLANSFGTLSLTDDAIVNAVSTYVGKGANSNGTVSQTGGTFNATGANIVFQIGMSGNGVWNQSAGTVNGAGWIALGRFATGIGNLNVSGGTFNQTAADRGIIVGEDGTGTLTVSGTGTVNINGTAIGLAIGWGATGNGTVNLDGGTLSTPIIQKGTGPSATFNFDGGTLVAAPGANTNFLAGLTAANVEDGGAIIDTNGNDITIAQALLNAGGGALTKNGAGTLNLTGANTYTGATTLSTGTLLVNGDQTAATGLTSVAASTTLGGSGIIGGSVTNSGTIAPGNSTGNLTVNGDVTFASGSSLVIEIDETQTPINDTLTTIGALDLTTNPTLTINISGSLTQPSYLIASYGTTLSGDFTVGSLPPGYTIVHNAGAKTISLVSESGSAFESWLADFFPGETDEAIIGLNADPDGDGVSNLLEFALNGNPDNGSDNGTSVVMTKDSSDAGAGDDLIITLAVRKTAPEFAGTPTPSSNVDGITYNIEGSLDLADGFTAAVSEVDVETGDLPALPIDSDYEYRSFRLEASEGLPGTGFLRVKVIAD